MREVEGRSHCSVAAGLGEVVSTGDKLSLHACLVLDWSEGLPGELHGGAL